MVEGKNVHCGKLTHRERENKLKNQNFKVEKEDTRYSVTSKPIHTYMCTYMCTHSHMNQKLVVVVYTWYPSTQEAEAAELWVGGPTEATFIISSPSGEENVSQTAWERREQKQEVLWEGTAVASALSDRKRLQKYELMEESKMPGGKSYSQVSLCLLLPVWAPDSQFVTKSLMMKLSLGKGQHYSKCCY